MELYITWSTWSHHLDICCIYFTVFIAMLWWRWHSQQRNQAVHCQLNHCLVALLSPIDGITLFNEFPWHNCCLNHCMAINTDSKSTNYFFGVLLNTVILPYNVAHNATCCLKGTVHVIEILHPSTILWSHLSCNSHSPVSCTDWI